MTETRKTNTSRREFLKNTGKVAATSALAAGIFHRREVPISDVKAYLKGKVEIRL